MKGDNAALGIEGREAGDNSASSIGGGDTIATVRRGRYHFRQAGEGGREWEMPLQAAARGLLWGCGSRTGQWERSWGGRCARQLLSGGGAGPPFHLSSPAGVAMRLLGHLLAAAALQLVPGECGRGQCGSSARRRSQAHGAAVPGWGRGRGAPLGRGLPLARPRSCSVCCGASVARF